MIVGNTYRIIKRVKIHTSPLVMADVVKEGVYVRETLKSYIFNTFRVSKSVVTKIEDLGG